MEFIVVPIAYVLVAVGIMVYASTMTLIAVKFALIFGTIDVLLDPDVLPQFMELIVKDLLFKCL